MPEAWWQPVADVHWVRVGGFSCRVHAYLKTIFRLSTVMYVAVRASQEEKHTGAQGFKGSWGNTGRSC